jgi:uncharacterized DUF497 family protein
VEFEYDSAKSESNRTKHGIDFRTAKSLWLDPNRVEFVARFSAEVRYGLIGSSRDNLWVAIFTFREEKTRIISVRRARENEKETYHNR